MAAKNLVETDGCFGQTAGVAGKVLIIDDDLELLDSLVKLVAAAGFDARGAGSATAGWEMIFQFGPDIVISDINMQPVNGFELLSMIRNHPDISHLPVIVMTVESDRLRMRKGMQLGADDYLDKPFPAAELVATIRTQLDKRKLVRAAIDKQVGQLRANLAFALPHEFNTPLAVILGMAQVIVEDEQAAAQTRHMAEGIIKAGQRLSRLVKNFLLYSQCEQMALDPAATAELRAAHTPATRDLISLEARTRAEQMGRSHDLVLEVDESGVAMGDQHLVKILGELIDNAFKYSAPGKAVTVRTRPEGRNLLLSVTDHGRGFPAGAAREVGAFVQFNRKLHEQQGMGLGLAIVRRLAEMHGGSLQIHNAGEAGTTVEVRLPAHPQ